MADTHSPGPWRVNKDGTGGGAVEDANGKIVVYDEGAPNDADAALIAAAPEMLELLGELEWRTGYGGEETPLDFCGICGGTFKHRGDCRLAALLARLPLGSKPYETCQCPCHTSGGAMRHFVACCGPGSAHPELSPPRKGEP